MSQFAARSVKVLAAWPFLAKMAAGFSGWRSQSLVLTLAAASVLLAVGLSAAPAAAGTAGITLKPSAGPPTSKVTVTGTGFGATETVAVDFSGAQVATATTSSTGTFSAKFTVPKSALPGNQPVTATGQTSSRSATKNFLVQANWAKFHFDAVNSGLNPYENVISPANVSGLTTAWSEKSTSSIASSPAVYNGVVYVGSQFNGLKAYSATSGTLLWTGATQNGAQINVSSPAVANGVVYIAATDNSLYAFKAAGCGGTTCEPLWTAAIGNNSNADQSSPTVVNGVVYVASGSTLDAFSTTSHALLWSAPNVSDEWAPAVANGVVYIGGGGYPAGIVAFSANGKGCSGTPLVCTPLWTGDADTTAANSSPAVVKGVVYVGANTNLYAFSAAGCSAALCQPLWHGTLSNNVSSSPAVANGVAYITSADGNFYAFSTSSRTLLWTAVIGSGDNSSPAVANGVVYVGSHGLLYAFKATGCSAATCQPLWTAPNPGGGNATYSSPAVANGMVYIGQWNGGGPYFAAYKLP
jgi:outer membrane protein assembly factor BamB